MPVIVGDRVITPAELTVGQAMRLGKAVDQLRAALGLGRGQLALAFSSPDAASATLAHLLTGAMGLVDLDAEGWPKPTAVFLRELGAVWGLSAEEVADLTLGQAAELAAETWEANAQGPFGQRLKAMWTATTASFGPSLTTMVEAFTLRMTSALMADPPPGGISDGGTTSSSSPLPTPSDGPTAASEPWASDAPSSSLPASDTASPSEPPPSALP